MLEMIVQATIPVREIVDRARALIFFRGFVFMELQVSFRFYI